MQANNFLQHSTKMLFSAGFAAAVTGLLIILMHYLIAMEVIEIPAVQFKPIDITMPADRDIDAHVDKPIEKPVDPQPQPQMPELPQNFENTTDLTIAIAPPPVIGGPTISGPDSGSAIAIFRVAPQYPRRAIAKGIEGFVDLMFDIGPTGKTENIRIIYAQPAGYFESASKRTLAKWKYKPALDDGIPQVQKNQTTRIVFELEK